MESRQCLIAAALLLLSATATAAELVCSPSDTIEDCWDKASGAPIQPKAREERTDAAANDVEERLKKFETGLDGGASALATTTKNLLPLLSLFASWAVGGAPREDAPVRKEGPARIF